MSMLSNNTQLPNTLPGIIRGCLNGNRADQAKLYQMYASKMMTVCLWYSPNREEAEEILQDGFMRVFTYLHKYRGEGPFDAWIRKIMVNAALSKYRSKTSTLRVVSHFNAELHDVKTHSSIESDMDAGELMELIQTLPPGYRMVFNLYVLEGFKHSEIAQALHISEGTSKSNLSDARKILQKTVAVYQHSLHTNQKANG